MKNMHDFEGDFFVEMQDKTDKNTCPDEQCKIDLFSEDIKVDTTTPFIKIDGEFQWKDSLGNLHPLPIK